jgi:putative peptidoglycan lipid II flippase
LSNSAAEIDGAAGQALAKATSAGRGGMRSTLLVSAATLASRLLGLVREQLFATLLGAGMYADAFVVAFRIPNLLRDLFAEGALSAAFVPVFAKVEKDEGQASAYGLANRTLGALTLLVGTITLLGMLFATPLVHALAPGFASQEPGKLELTATLAVIMMPFLPLLSFAAVTMGILNARGRFTTPALAPALFNVAAIAVGAGLKLEGAAPRTAVIGWAVGTLLGGFLQFAVQLPPLMRDGYRFALRCRGLWRDPHLARIARLMAPATLGLAATQVNIFINTQFASTEPGANAWLNYAFRLMYLPIGIFGVAIATVTASNLARRAAERDLAGVRDGLALGLRHVALLTIPSTVGLLVLAEPIIGLIYQHGRFTATDTERTAIALCGYGLGLYAYSGVKVVAPAFYALDHSRIPLIASAGAVATNLTLNLLLHDRLGYLGLAVGTSLGALVNLAVLTTNFRRLTTSIAPARGVLAQLAKVCAASLVMGGVVWAAARAVELGAVGAGMSHGLGLHALQTIVGVAIGAAVYAAVCSLLRVTEVAEVVAALRRRRAR